MDDMNILLTGATGFIGSSVLPRLLDEGHSVTALVRDDQKADVVRAAGATALVGDAADAALVERAARESDGVIHLASSKDVDAVLVPAVLAGLAGTGKPFVHTGGIWTYGDNDDITEESPAQPPALTAWRATAEQLVRDAEGVRGTVVVPSIVYGHGKGLANVIVDAPRGSGTVPALRLIGDGSQHWATVHVDDLAALYVLALEQGAAGATYIAAGGQNPTVRELGEAAAQAAGIAGGVAAESVDESRGRLGEALTDALLLDQQARGTRPRIDLGWEPNGPSLLEELLVGSYAPARV
ncbi:Nucleoside-diphosphate-sugar epimerase [Leifsonia sp. 98AMF]|nr:Nucleoside-diphosphate-sugar epimerase [Leifsonia sp. 197AMF]SDJ02982.1 Nucleoside-diphosphate-sugar epimerase [Leifsonia sp. 466MF]SDJ70036.1 Nucleoside-diphosphate-sugar epimerase [Leifsonia sp. 157MF]SDO06731.1 Nucleoside-diphosphate-sugar epimerase [Leifsonia sp. 509MF]SEM97246.1 Nucleoside-diphosphate-sugar epimerase [Leifsonia sp. 467MF]SFM23554.1 Nucleoside-diphosphate-sugar epimerase [Leifsonia sp. 98AMF]